jgi:prepilin peptidase CpaA
MASFSVFITAICIGLLGLAALHDVAFRTIPAGLSPAIAAAGVALRWLDQQLPAALLIAALVFAAGFLCWKRGWLGGGDVKLLAAATLALPPGLVMSFAVSVSLCGGGLALFYVLASQLVTRPQSARPVGLFARIVRAEQWRLRRRGPLPYALAIAAGFALTISGEHP